MLNLGECDCCGEVRPLRVVIAYGIETGACTICQGGSEADLEEEFAELEDTDG